MAQDAPRGTQPSGPAQNLPLAGPGVPPPMEQRTMQHAKLPPTPRLQLVPRSPQGARLYRGQGSGLIAVLELRLSLVEPLHTSLRWSLFPRSVSKSSPLAVPSLLRPPQEASGLPMNVSATSRQPARTPWTEERLRREMFIALGHAVDANTIGTYTSALNSYLTFCSIHNRSPEPTEETLCFFVVFMSAHINPRSVNSYLSGICNQLEPFFPEIRARRNGVLVSRVMAGCLRRFGTPVRRKRPLTEEDVVGVVSSLGASNAHDDLLFLAMLLTGRDGLLRLGELTMADASLRRNARKLVLRHTVHVAPDQYSFFLPYHKADRYYEGNTIIIQRNERVSNPLPRFSAYLASRDAKFILNRELWLRDNGTVPTRAWFIARLRTFFANDVAGQSLRAGGATSLAEAGVPPNVIQAIGRWSSDTFQIYIRKNPVLLQAMLTGRPVHQPAPRAAA